MAYKFFFQIKKFIAKELKKIYNNKTPVKKLLAADSDCKASKMLCTSVHNLVSLGNVKNLQKIRNVILKYFYIENVYLRCTRISIHKTLFFLKK